MRPRWLSTRWLADLVQPNSTDRVRSTTCYKSRPWIEDAMDRNFIEDLGCGAQPNAYRGPDMGNPRAFCCPYIQRCVCAGRPQSAVFCSACLKISPRTFWSLQEGKKYRYLRIIITTRFYDPASYACACRCTCVLLLFVSVSCPPFLRGFSLKQPCCCCRIDPTGTYLVASRVGGISKQCCRRRRANQLPPPSPRPGYPPPR